MGCGSSHAAPGKLPGAPPEASTKSSRTESTPAAIVPTAAVAQAYKRVQQLNTTACTLQDIDKALAAAKTSNPNAVLDCARDAIEAVAEALPEVADVIVTIANVAIPPPGGQVLGILIRIGELVVKDSQGVKAAHVLVAETSKTVALVLKKAKKGSENSMADADVAAVLHELRDVGAEIKEFVEDVLGRQMWVARMLTWNTTHQKLNAFKDRLNKVLAKVGAVSGMAALSFVEAAQEAQAEFQSVYGHALAAANVTDIEETNIDQLENIAKALRSAGSAETQVIMSVLQQVISLQKQQILRTYENIRNGCMRDLWQRTFAGTEQDRVKWKAFWAAFPERLNIDEPAKQSLSAYFADERNRSLLQSSVEECGADFETLSVHEINLTFATEDVSFRFVSLHVAVSRAWLLGIAGRSLGKPFGTGVHKLHQRQVVRALHQLTHGLHRYLRQHAGVITAARGSGDVDIYKRARELVEKFRSRGPGARDLALCEGFRPRECVGVLKELVRKGLAAKALEPRVVTLLGWPGDGKFTTATAAVLELLKEGRPAGQESIHPQPGFLGAGYVAELAGVTDADALDARILSALVARVPEGQGTWANVHTQLNVVRAMSTMERPFRVVLIFDHVHELPEHVGKHLVDRIRDMLKLVDHMVVILCARLGEGNTPIMKHLDGAFKTQHRLEPMDAEEAGELLRALVSERHQLDAQDAQDLAKIWTCNPTVLKLMARLFNSGEFDGGPGGGPDLQKAKGFQLNADGSVSKEGLQSAVIQALGVLKSSGDVVKFVLLCDVFGNRLRDNGPRSVLGISDDKMRKVYINNHLVTRVGGMHMVVPLIKGVVRSLLSDYSVDPGDVEEQHPALAPALMEALAQQLPTRVTFIKYLEQELTRLFKLYLTTPRTAYQEIVSFRDDVHMVLRWLQEEDRSSGLLQDASVCGAVVGLLFNMRLTPTAFDPQAVQTACRSLASTWESDSATRVAAGTCRAVGALFYQATDDGEYGQRRCLEEADSAIDLLNQGVAQDGSSQRTLALALAHRARGLILREKSAMKPCLAALTSGHELLQPLVNALDVDARLEDIIILAELSGSLDYDKAYDDGVRVGKQAVTTAKDFFSLLKCAQHPILGLALGSLGYNLKSRGDLQEALDAHEEARAIREGMLGLMHKETAMSLNQLGIVYQKMAERDLDAAEGAGAEVRASLLGHAQTQLAKAEQVTRQSLDVRRKCLPSKDRLIANTLFNLAELLRVIGLRLNQPHKLAEALDVGRECLALRKQLMDPDHEKVKAVEQLIQALEHIEA